jgi:hypothetical protein
MPVSIFSILNRCDRQGKQTLELQLDATQGQVRWRTAGQQRGLYYCIIEQAGYRSPPLKLLLID